ncbi:MULTISPECIES: hypothetical protein [Pseudomonas]|uniref:hypothetical protein n=1 Tax=Pseudomonas TaxID=286 RepID=UPI0012DC495B|nr:MULTISPECIES: hypothetical protein [Pseudomonas]
MLFDAQALERFAVDQRSKTPAGANAPANFVLEPALENFRKHESTSGGHAKTANR